ncbi:hypothetical protein GN958_ATG15224 [Phytophthora infestans]|uniref:Uncharacterized protein n=1 Tax=Phytophthora infestans TaxID=4787 RepID=A0A8S9U3N3_PHYIN|nr:hypothetical protein GN958_ATG15224 [Phytophthora infestans]
MGRKRVSGTGRRPRTFERVSVDYKHKLNVLNFLDTAAGTGDAITKFYPNVDDPKEKKQKQRQFWSSQKSRPLIKYMCSHGKGHYKNARKLGDAIILPDGAEQYLVTWINF